MNFKFLSISLLFGLTLFMFTACEKENLDTTTNEEEEVNTLVVTCDDWQLAIGHDGFGNLSTASGGGTAPFTYLWSTGETTENITVTTGGTYSVTVTDAEGCIVEDEKTITLADPCEIVALEIEENPAGTLTAIPSEGTAPYIYLWSTGETTASITVIASGAYSATVTDANGCVVVDEIMVTIVDPCDGFEAYADEQPPNSGVLSVLHSGGTWPFTYLWSTGETTGNITVLDSGTYSYTVTDAIGCVLVGEITVTINTVPCSGFNVLIAEQPPGSNDLYTSPTGGTVPYSYLWSTGETTANITAPGSGTYSVTVTDAEGCVTMDEIVI